MLIGPKSAMVTDQMLRGLGGEVLYALKFAYKGVSLFLLRYGVSVA